MSYFSYLRESDDLVRNLDISTGFGANYGSSVPGFPATNLMVSDIAQLYVGQAPDATGYADVWSFDLGGSVPWNQICIINHDFDPSVVVTVKSGTTGAAIDHSDTMTFRQFNQYFRTATRTDRYIELRINDSILTVHRYSVGRLMIGVAQSPLRDPSYIWRRRRVAVNRSTKSELGARRVKALYKQFEFTFTFAVMSVAELNDLTAFTDSINGDAEYLFFIPDTSVYDGYLVRMTSTTNEETIGVRADLSDVILTEEMRGTRIGA